MCLDCDILLYSADLFEQALPYIEDHRLVRKIRVNILRLQQLSEEGQREIWAQQQAKDGNPQDATTDTQRTQREV
jgi:hypothetical protein